MRQTFLLITQNFSVMSTPLLSLLTAWPVPLSPYRSPYRSPVALTWTDQDVSGFQTGPAPVRCRRNPSNPRVLTSGFGFQLLYTEFRYIFSEHIFPKHFCKRATGSPLSNYLYVFYCHGIPQFWPNNNNAISWNKI